MLYIYKIQYFMFRCYGDTKHLRKLFPKALTSVKDWPESIANAWINFERDEGTLEQMEICEVKTKERLDKVAEERKNSVHFSTAPEETSKKAGKRKIEDSGRWKNLGASSTKVAKFDQSKPILKESSFDSEKNKSNDVASNKAKPKGAPPPGYQEAKEEKMEDESNSGFEKVDENITIFVSNLDYTATEEEIREALKPVGPITLFRMVTDYKGRSKGFCYVQLSSPVSQFFIITLFSMISQMHLKRRLLTLISKVLVKSIPLFVSRKL